jgi:DNA gyrase subunit A
VYKFPEAGRHSRGKPIVNLLELKEGERIAAFVPVREFDDKHFIVAVTRQGVINKQTLSAYANVRRDGINAIHLDENDSVIECKLTNGRNTRGVRGIRLRGDDQVVGMIIVNEKDDVLTVTEKGYGKRTSVADYRKTNRGGSGIINIKVTEKNGPVVALKGVYRDGDVMLITRNGIIIRSNVKRISIIGRNTQGVRLISLEEGDSLIDVAMCEKDENGTAGEGAEELPPEIPAPQ